jgi:hypothetical protein
MTCRWPFLGITMRAFYGKLAVIVLCMLGATSAGCASSGGTRSPSVNRNILNRSQIDARYSTAYEAVEALRSNWFNSRGADSFSNPSVVRVYLDNVLLGDKEALRTIQVQNIAYMQWYDGVSATSRWGTNHGAGVIYVSTRPAGVGDPKP